ncbi:hypothetical protein BAZSYMA_ACONTIG160217_0 [Bathymodiolus azoricus thioautotrophic gill symbiont]|uniref:Uncharacterized protein n=1 Tax=Bathymodiolus azoricus thioautotrophic gill symbiont TaxID=235205 RepID=A0A1H6LSQ2_9GAMM|nr:hypothetical protein BAZSYMA_ACONTIG160217_0 [Bathymodiolus azoricus thioautotrophic gill symbiont]
MTKPQKTFYKMLHHLHLLTPQRPELQTKKIIVRQQLIELN